MRDFTKGASPVDQNGGHCLIGEIHPHPSKNDVCTREPWLGKLTPRRQMLFCIFKNSIMLERSYVTKSTATVFPYISHYCGYGRAGCVTLSSRRLSRPACGPVLSCVPSAALCSSRLLASHDSCLMSYSDSALPSPKFRIPLSTLPFVLLFYSLYCIEYCTTSCSRSSIVIEVRNDR